MNKELFNYAVRLLAQRPYHSVELRQKIIHKKHADIEVIEEVIRKLESHKYLNDQEYLNLFIRGQLQRKPQGVRIISQKLSQKGIPQDQIKAAITNHGLAESELEQADKALHKKLRTLKALSPLQKKAKLYRFLIARGFSSQTIMKALASVAE